ncbi:hypothetical protein B0H14DRAFT_3426938 [Mycena olivaceomarginata]|nr:hypothetical protein B0H14DRAFT_3426938 [Mycena olivaceomarginata]
MHHNVAPRRHRAHYEVRARVLVLLFRALADAAAVKCKPPSSSSIARVRICRAAQACSVSLHRLRSRLDEIWGPERGTRAHRCCAQALSMKTEWVGGDVDEAEVLMPEYAVVKDEDNMMFTSTRSSNAYSQGRHQNRSLDVSCGAGFLHFEWRRPEEEGEEAERGIARNAHTRMKCRHDRESMLLATRSSHHINENTHTDIRPCAGCCEAGSRVA